MKLFILVLEVERLKEEEFREWLLHCTLVYWFRLDGKVATLIETLGKFYENFTPPKLLGEETALFGPKLAVTLVKKTNALQHLHDETIKKVVEVGGIFVDEKYMHQNYKPHVTQHGGRTLKTGETVSSEAVYLVESINESPKIRKMVSRFQIGQTS